MFTDDLKGILSAEKEWQDKDGKVLSTKSFGDEYVIYSNGNEEPHDHDHDMGDKDPKDENEEMKDDFKDLMDEAECPMYERKQMDGTCKADECEDF